MRNWFRTRRQVQPRSLRQPRRPYRPAVEGLEERCLLSVAVDPIPNQTVPSGKSLLVPITATDSDGLPITYSVTSSSPSITAQLHPGNPFLDITVAGFGDMVFQLFQDLTPQTVQTISTLVENEFYNGLTFHRIVPNFVIQGGDPAGNGTGGPGFTFANEYLTPSGTPGPIYSGNGELGMANSGSVSSGVNAGAATNGSQFFITIGPQRFLDYNNTIFGQLVRGFNVLDAIESVPTDPTTNAPLTPVVISRAQIVPDTSDTVLTLSSDAGFTGSATITVTGTDSNGAVGTQTFTASAVTDSVNDPAILGPVTNQVDPSGGPFTFTLTGHDLENDPLTFEAVETDTTTNAKITILPGGGGAANTASVTVTPNAGFTGPIHLKVGVEDAGATSRGSTSNPFDENNIVVAVGDEPLTGQPASLTATEGSAASLQNVVVATFTDADVTATAADFTATANWGDGTKDGTSALLPATVSAGLGGVFTVTASKPAGYEEAGTFPVKVAVTDTLGATANITSSVVVSDAPLTAQGVPITATQGSALNNVLVATFTDADPHGQVSDYRATIDWGDGQTSPGTIQQGSGNTFQVLGSHTYTSTGTLPVNVTIDDINPITNGVGASAPASTTATITVPTTPVPTNQVYVTSLYLDVLGRAPDPQGLAYFSTILDEGLVNRYQVALAIETSLEARTIQVETLYQTMLNRDADPVALANDIFFLGGLGGTIEQLKAIIAGSQEYFQVRGGGTNSGFLNALYEDAFGRPVDSFGQQGALPLLNQGYDRTLLAEQLFTSPEAGQVTVEHFYSTYFHRPVDPSGFQSFTNAFSAGIRDELLIMTILGSDEYFNQG